MRRFADPEVLIHITCQFIFKIRAAELNFFLFFREDRRDDVIRAAAIVIG